jgi:hypothetical protein
MCCFPRPLGSLLKAEALVCPIDDILGRFASDRQGDGRHCIGTKDGVILLEHFKPRQMHLHGCQRWKLINDEVFGSIQPREKLRLRDIPSSGSPVDLNFQFEQGNFMKTF